MPKKLFSFHVLVQAKTVVSAWTQIGTTVTLGALLSTALTDFSGLAESYFLSLLPSPSSAKDYS